MSLIQLINGPNLNRLGRREPEIYGASTLADIEQRLTQLAQAQGHQLRCSQSNAESELITAIHTAGDDNIEFIIINPAAFTHTSVALRDALLAVAIPFIEVHISNVYRREEFRSHSYFSDIAIGVICGLGVQGYEFALDAALTHLSSSKPSAPTEPGA